jgi:hypothetical protein
MPAGALLLAAAAATADPASCGCSRRFLLTYGVSGGAPQALAASAGLVLGTRLEHGPAVLAKGVLLQAEAGSTWGGLHAGPGFVIAVRGEPGTPAVPLLGLAMQGSVLRAWSPGPGVLPSTTYAGARLKLTAVVSLGASLLWRVDGDARSRRRVFAWDVGMGF